MPLTQAERIEARYIPKNSQAQEHPELGAVIYLSTNKDHKPSAIAYIGTGRQAAFHYSFPTEEARAAYIEKWLEGRRERARIKDESRISRKEATHTLEPGDIVFTTWGYDQTNVEFFQIVEKVSNKSVRIRKIKANTIETDFMAGYTLPLKDQFMDDSPAKLKRAIGNQVVLGSFRGRATKTTPEAKHRCSSYA